MTDQELEHRFALMESRITAHISQQCEAVETKLLSAFHGWARSMEIRVRSITALDERLGLAEERIGELERRKDTA
jgi:hypothetical protein